VSNSELNFLATLESIVADRLENPSRESYTASLIASGPQRVAQKVGEEAVELALASVGGDRNDIVNEAADLLFHMLVLLRNQDVVLADVVRELESRHTA